MQFILFFSQGSWNCFWGLLNLKNMLWTHWHYICNFIWWWRRTVQKKKTILTQAEYRHPNLAPFIASYCWNAGSARGPSSWNPMGMDPWACWAFSEKERKGCLLSRNSYSIGVYISLILITTSHPSRKREGPIDNGQMVRKSKSWSQCYKLRNV